MKQYTVEEAYSRNVKITRYCNGKEEYYNILSDWQVDGYCMALEEQGYTRAYDVEKYEQAMNEAKEAYENAKYIYEEVRKNPLIK